ncbi:MAG: Dam family site-specific DNA-(adenine-N6)-methyltransferase [Nitrosomonadales bacterium]|nr:Dam family site-specific DNA-(adenine-N6)-methyltransferase [Nitrosomonadales bacterium]
MKISELENLKVQTINPFLKWAGGKRWLTTTYPDLLPENYKRYYEVFLGSGAVFFSMRPQMATLSDLNEELIECYSVLRDDWQNVVERLHHHQLHHSKDYYYEVRNSKPRTLANKAARFVYLNRTCWNGLYRVNLSGEFNVPVGTKTNVLLDSDNFEVLSALLKKTRLLAADFEEVIDKAKSGDFIFADPPYTVRHNLNGFVKYNEKIFHWDDQIRLRDCLVRASNRGCLVLLTNANHPSVVELYENDFELISLSRSSVIAADSKNRGMYEELVAKNF